MTDNFEHTSQRIVVNTQTDQELATGRLLSQVDVSISLYDYEFIDYVSKKTEGVSFIELGAVDSRRAYKIAKLALRRLAEVDMTATVINGEVVANRRSSSAPELTAIGQAALASCLPDEDITEIRFTVGVYPSVHDIYALKLDPDSNIPIVEMRVSPPDLAA